MAGQGEIKLVCKDCQFWQPRDREHDVSAPCSMGVMYGLAPFDYTPCQYHSERGKVAEGAALLSEAIKQQSQARGLTYQEWVQRLGAGK